MKENHGAVTINSCKYILIIIISLQHCYKDEYAKSQFVVSAATVSFWQNLSASYITRNFDTLLKDCAQIQFQNCRLTNLKRKSSQWQR